MLEAHDQHVSFSAGFFPRVVLCVFMFVHLGVILLVALVYRKVSLSLWIQESSCSCNVLMFLFLFDLLSCNSGDQEFHLQVSIFLG